MRDGENSVPAKKLEQGFVFVKSDKIMTRKEFYLIAIIVIYTYLAIIFQLSVKNFISMEKNPHAKISFNLFD